MRTLGWYESELIRRTDPAGRTLGRYFSATIAEPLGLDFYIGLPDSVDRERIARLHGFTPFESLLHLREMPWQFMIRVLNPSTLTARAFSNPRELTAAEAFNRADVQRLEVPATNGVGTARSVAEAYATTITDRTVAGNL